MPLEQYPEPFRRLGIELFKEELPNSRKSLDEVRLGRASVTSHQVHFYRRMDEVFSALPALDEELACKQGCSFCCHYHVYVTAPEALAISEHVRSLPAPLQAHLTARLKANAEQAARLGLHNHILTNIACAFLSPEGACSIYALRPSACRRHHSYDVEPCKATFDDPKDPGQNPQSPAILAAGDAMMAATLAAAHQAGIDTARYEMSGAITEALSNKASARRWRDGKTSFPSVADREDEFQAED